MYAGSCQTVLYRAFSSSGDRRNSPVDANSSYQSSVDNIEIAGPVERDDRDIRKDCAGCCAAIA
jgi:hypothetical protein